MAEGQMYINQYFGPGSQIPAGSVLLNCTIASHSVVGERSQLFDCIFTCTPKQDWSQVKGKSEVAGGVWNCVVFEGDRLVSGQGGAYSGQLTNETHTTSPTVSEYKSEGHIIAPAGVLDMAKNGDCACQDEWDKDVRQKGYHIIGDGAEVSVPEGLIACEEKK